MGNHPLLAPEDVAQSLKSGARTQRTVNSLNIIHEVCKEQFERGSKDFSYSTIGKLSERLGGPKAQPIRNAAGAVYRTLIDTWAKFSETGKSKVSAPRPQSLGDDVLSLIDDSVARVLVQNYLSENRKLKHENAVLKVAAKETVIIDLSGKTRSNPSGVEVVTPASFLLEQERLALRNAISAENIRKQGWTIDEQTGSVSKGPLPVFSPGFASAIRKILGEID